MEWVGSQQEQSCVRTNARSPPSLVGFQLLAPQESFCALCPVTNSWCSRPSSLLASEGLSGDIRFMLVEILSQWFPEGK